MAAWILYFLHNTKIMNTFFCIFTLILLICNCHGKIEKYVSCGSVLKLKNVRNGVRLHSHDVKYGTGSGQQSVTGSEQTEDVNSHWLIKADTGSQCQRGEPVKCGDVIRLEHLATGKNLHSHYFTSPLSGNQEISAYGDNGLGDTGDHWKVVCDSSLWERNSSIRLRHIDTDIFLSVSGKTYGRPIQGQMEIVGVSWDDGASDWQAAEGLFIHKSDFNPKTSAQLHDEL